jgi:hypothetical protein
VKKVVVDLEQSLGSFNMLGKNDQMADRMALYETYINCTKAVLCQVQKRKVRRIVPI